MHQPGTKKAIIIGHKGQDGTLLKQSLETQGWDVLGIGRKDIYSTAATPGINPVDILDKDAVRSAVNAFRPSEIYYLAAYHTASQEKVSALPADEFRLSQEVHVTGLLHFLNAIQQEEPTARLFYASSSLVFSGIDGPVQDEQTKFTPVGFYGITKATGILLCKEYRERYGVFASAGILYNHESSLRQPKFLSQKIIQAAIRIANGSAEKLELGDLSAQVDWSYAPDFIEAFQYVLRTEESDDFIIASGAAHRVEEFVEIVFAYFGLNWKTHVVENNSIMARRIPVKAGDAAKLRQKTGWKSKRSFNQMVEQLVVDTLNVKTIPA